MLHHKCSPQVTRSLTPSLTLSFSHSTSPSQAQAQAQPLSSISLSRSGCQVQMPYHTRHSLPCLALIFTRSADTPNPRPHRRQAAAPFREAARRATNADHSHFLGHANCALLAGRPISSRCGRPPRLPAGFNPSSRF
jgi:hypothetical protein